MDAIERFKAMQREAWTHFAVHEATTTPTAARLVAHSRIGPADRVLDVGCGTGVVAITAARMGARVTGLDLTPALLARGRENASIAGVSVEFYEGDVEQMPFRIARSMSLSANSATCSRHDQTSRPLRCCVC
jgi:ubiquinone/menaquinone biosynthesis C-methylase UbiE